MRYPTRYNDMTNEEVHELYRTDTWEELSCEERIDALQELANRAAEEYGIEPCKVRLEDMNGAMYGVYYNKEIMINRSLVENGELTYTYQDNNGDILTGTHKTYDSNTQLMDTINHENYHSYQDEVINDRVYHQSSKESELWKANDKFYIEEGELYRIQSLEKSAFSVGQTKTREAFEALESKYGEDSGYRNYIKNVSRNSYENSLANAKEEYGDENIEESLNNKMLLEYQNYYSSNMSNSNNYTHSQSEAYSESETSTSSSTDDDVRQDHDANSDSCFA